MTHKKAIKRAHTCLKCGESWQSIVELPSRCARCGVRTWTLRKPQEIEEIDNSFQIPERFPYGKPCWLYYEKGNASGGQKKLGGYIGVASDPNRLPKQAKITVSHRGWVDD